MCRYDWKPYKQHYICLDCRFSAKYSEKHALICPHCRKDLIAMGKDFKPPRKKSDNQWKKIALLVEQGKFFYSCGCGGPGWRPKTLGEAKRKQ